MQNMEKEGKIKYVTRLTWKKYEGMEEMKDLGLYEADEAHVIIYQRVA